LLRIFKLIPYDDAADVSEPVPLFSIYEFQAVCGSTGPVHLLKLIIEISSGVHDEFGFVPKVIAVDESGGIAGMVDPVNKLRDTTNLPSK
jgi:hypothetical protein